MASTTVGKPARRRRATASRNGSGRSKSNGQLKSGQLDPEILLTVLSAVKSGDFSKRVPEGRGGLSGKIYDAINEMIAKNEMLTS